MECVDELVVRRVELSEINKDIEDVRTRYERLGDELDELLRDISESRKRLIEIAVRLDSVAVSNRATSNALASLSESLDTACLLPDDDGPTANKRLRAGP